MTGFLTIFYVLEIRFHPCIITDCNVICGAFTDEDMNKISRSQCSNRYNTVQGCWRRTRFTRLIRNTLQIIENVVHFSYTFAIRFSILRFCFDENMDYCVIIIICDLHGYLNMTSFMRIFFLENIRRGTSKRSRSKIKKKNTTFMFTIHV